MHRTLLFAAVTLAACSPETELTLTTDATIAGQRVTCGTDVAVGTGTKAVQVADARLFLSGIQLLDSKGEWVDLLLDQESDWQHEDVVLLDYEDGTASCADSGTDETNDRIVGTVPKGNYEGIRFDVGVPFELNHNDSATAPSPLNTTGMFWTWQGGYKFVRVDWAVATDVPSRWNVHLGSTGCASDAPVIGPEEECASPNRASIELAGFDPEVDVLALDLGALVADTDLDTNKPESPPGCMSSPGEPEDCADIFAALGLDFATGTCADDCDAQAVFGVEAP